MATREPKTDIKEIMDAIRVHASAARSEGGAGAVDYLENILLHLESSDDFFHRYGIVKRARDQVSTLTSSFLDSCESIALSHGEHEAVCQVAQAILASPQYAALKKRFVEMAQEGMVALQAGGDDEAPSSFLEDEFYDGFEDSDDDETELDDLGESFFGLLPPGHELRRIARNLAAQYPPDTRLDALRALARLSPGDLVVSEHWSLIRTQLRAALADGEEVIFRETLLLHLRMFGTGIGGVVRDIFLHFVSHLQAASAAGLLGIATPCAVGNPGTRRILLQVQVLHTMLLALPRHWVRFGERQLAEAVDAAMATLFPVGGSALLCYLALADPRAAWFARWMSGNISRQHVFDYFRRQPAALQAIAAAVDTLGQMPAQRPGPPSPGAPQPLPCPLPPLGTALEDSFVYSKSQLEYLADMHSVCVVGEILLYPRGRGLLAVGNGAAAILATLVRQLCGDGRAPAGEESAFFQRGVLAADLLKRVVAHAMPAEQPLLDGPAVAMLAEYVRCAAPALADDATLPAAGEVLLDIADILGLLAMSVKGRALLLAGDPATCAAATLAEFVSAVLAAIARHHGAANSSLVAVAQACLFVCRQLCSTHTGLQVLLPLALHRHIAAGLATAGPDTSWHALLLDSLLNYAWTPHGVELLAGLPANALRMCVARMFERFRQKMQVSKYEKFGYGVMVVELACSAAGMAALQHTGFVDFVLATLEHTLATFVDYKVPGSQANALSHAGSSSKAFRKALGYALMVLATPAAADSIAPSPDAAPAHAASTAAFIRSLAESSGAELVPREHWDYARLRLLLLLCASLDTALLLEMQCGLTRRLLEWQRECCVDVDGVQTHIIDPCSLLRNSILVSTLLVGGPREKAAAPTSLSSTAGAPMPVLFSALPVPAVYVRPLADAPPTLAAIARSNSDIPADVFWAAAGQQHPALPSRPYAQQWTAHLAELLRSAGPAQASGPLPAVVLPAPSPAGGSSADGAPVHRLDTLASRLAVAYTDLLGLHADPAAAREAELGQLLTAMRAALPHPTAPRVDWFAVSLWLLMRKEAQPLLTRFASLPASVAAWPRRWATQAQYVVVAHWTGVMLHAELPLVAGALRLAGMSCSRVCLQWLQQCFWNVLDWVEISTYVTGCVLAGPAFPALYCVAVLRHLQDDILRAAQQQRLVDILLMSAVSFSLREQVGFMQTLQARYAAAITSHLMSIVS